MDYIETIGASKYNFLFSTLNCKVVKRTRNAKNASDGFLAIGVEYGRRKMYGPIVSAIVPTKAIFVDFTLKIEDLRESKICNIEMEQTTLKGGALGASIRDDHFWMKMHHFSSFLLSPYASTGC